MTSPPSPFPAMMWAGGPSRLLKPGLVTAQFDAAIWLAGLSISELEDVVDCRHQSLPWQDTDPVWAEPRLASLRTAWEQLRVNRDPADVRTSLDFTGTPLLEWLYQNLFAKLLEFALHFLSVDGEWVRKVPVGQVVADIDGGRNVRTVTLDNCDGFGSKRATIYSLDPVATVVTALVRSCAATNPEMEVEFLSYLIPYLVGSTPQDQWMSVDRALAYWKARVTSCEARAWEFGAAANCPTDEALRTMVALRGNSR